MIKLVAIDLDDTLIGSDLVVSPRNARAIRLLLRKRILVTLATGRTFQTAEPIAKKLGIKLPLICYHGALVRDRKRVYIEQMLPQQHYKDLIRFAHTHRLQIAFYASHHTMIYFNRPLNAYAKKYLDEIEQVTEITLVNFKTFTLPRTPIKCMMIASDKKIRQVYALAKRHWRNKLNIMITRPTLLEFMNPEINKGGALKFLAHMHHIPLRNVLAIGDGMNDVSMFAVAGYSAAVKNASAAVEREADIVVPSWDQDGVAEAIEWALASK